MGQIQDTCSCLYKKEDKTTYKFEPQHNNQENVNKITSKNGKKNFTLDPIKEEESDKTDQTGDESMGMKLKIYDDENSFSISKHKISKNLDTPQHNNAIIQIQKIAIGFLLRKHYRKSIKKELLKIEKELIDKLERNFITTNLIKAEREVKTSYDPKGWKKLYGDQESKLFNNNFGFLLNVKLFVEDKTSYYIGQMNRKMEKHGKGVKIDINGVKFEGFWWNNQFSGWGRMIDAEGVVYEGLFQNFKINGKGERINSKSYYKGEFKNGLREGFGIEETPEHSYVGEYLMDRKNGNGKLTYKKTKDVYEGEFLDNNITGFGDYIWANQDTFKGTFLNGKMHGKGIYKWPDGGEYIGEYIHNIKEGQGRFKWANGKIFEGPFKNGKPHGVGKLFYGNTNIEVEFKEGKLVRSPTPA